MPDTRSNRAICAICSVISQGAVIAMMREKCGPAHAGGLHQTHAKRKKWTFFFFSKAKRAESKGADAEIAIDGQENDLERTGIRPTERDRMESYGVEDG